MGPTTKLLEDASLPEPTPNAADEIGNRGVRDSPSLTCENLPANPHQNAPEMILTNPTAPTPKLIAPGIFFNQWPRPRLHEPGAQRGISEFPSHELLHHRKLDFFPVGPKSHTAPGALRFTRGGELAHALPLCAIERLGCLEGMLYGRIDHSLELDG
jgi:hypothetical protein